MEIEEKPRIGVKLGAGATTDQSTEPSKPNEESEKSTILRPKRKDGNYEWMGLPYKGPVRDFKEEDPQHMQPQYKEEAHVKVFELSNDADFQEYQQLVQRWASGRLRILEKDKAYDPDIKNWRFFISWVEPYYEAPPEDEHQRLQDAGIPQTSRPTV